MYNVRVSLAVLLAALGLLGALGLPGGRAGSVGRIQAYITQALAVLSAADVGAQFDALDYPPDVGEDDLSFLGGNGTSLKLRAVSIAVNPGLEPHLTTVAPQQRERPLTASRTTCASVTSGVLTTLIDRANVANRTCRHCRRIMFGKRTTAEPLMSRFCVSIRRHFDDFFRCRASRRFHSVNANRGRRSKWRSRATS